MACTTLVIPGMWPKSYNISIIINLASVCVLFCGCNGRFVSLSLSWLDATLFFRSFQLFITSNRMINDISMCTVLFCAGNWKATTVTARHCLLCLFTSHANFDTVWYEKLIRKTKYLTKCASVSLYMKTVTINTFVCTNCVLCKLRCVIFISIIDQFYIQPDRNQRHTTICRNNIQYQFVSVDVRPFWQ